MELIKQYINQSISTASNNLRLSTEKIEVVALLREMISNSGNLYDDIKRMKKITEFSTLAIRLNQIYDYLSEGKVDFLKLSDKYKEHSQSLIRDLNNMLDMVNPVTFKESIKKVKGEEEKETKTEVQIKAIEATEISIDFSKREADENIFETTESDKIKEEIILSEDKTTDDNSFENYESAVLKSIKPFDALLKDLSEKEINAGEIAKYAGIMTENEIASRKNGFNIIASMHNILAHSLLLIKSGVLIPSSDLIESMRACLIVIVALVKGKEVDISNYLNRAEEFGKKIINQKIT
ncbi:MAG: hypothetical protein WCE54_20810 [Ignavibacteriaceae bacterium]